MNALVSLSPAESVGLTLIGEARGEPIEGIIAVGSVIRNRLHTLGSKYGSYPEVCFADSQFSCWNSDSSERPMLLDLAVKMIHDEGINDPYLVQCLFIADGIVNDKLIDNTRGATFYMVSTLLNSIKAPSWSKARKNDIVYGHQTFFSLS
jgi:hypothetical protein